MSITGRDMPRKKTFWLAFSFLMAAVCFIGSCSDSEKEILSPRQLVETDTVVAGDLGDGWIGPFWPELINGDCEFGSNGPVVNLEAELYVKGADSLMCRVYMRAMETERNWSTAEDSWDELIYVAPGGWYIIDIGVTPVSCQVYYIDDDYDEDINACDPFTFRSKGDVSGDDIICGRVGDDNMTHVSVWMDSLYIRRELK
jgi:hypothetical protein